MPRSERSLWSRIAEAGDLPRRTISGPEHQVSLAELSEGTCLAAPLAGFAGAAVLVATADQLTAALVLIELDGIAARLVLCPPGVPPEHIPLAAATAAIDTIVTDGSLTASAVPDRCRVIRCGPAIRAGSRRSSGPSDTQWVLMTSGTTGLPKLVVHDLASLTEPIRPGVALPSTPPVWSTFYDIRRYGGLQIFLRAMLGGGSLVLSSAPEPVVAFFTRLGARGVTHISGTPSHWRRALISGTTQRIAPRYVRLSGEIADQAILDDLKAAFPDASVGHAFASTEAGVGFEVNDGLAGFPAELIGRSPDGVEIRLVDDSLRLRSPRTAARYLGDIGPLRDSDGFVDTGDIVERRGERYYFVGRRGGIINVGGLKVHPEEIEAVLNRHPAVHMSLVAARRNPFTGSVVAAQIVPRAGMFPDDPDVFQQDIIAFCRDHLPAYKVPATIKIVDSLEIGGAGKLARHQA